MSDLYKGVTRPDPERDRLFLSVFNPSPLEEVAEAVSVASEDHPHIYVERVDHEWRWSLATMGGPYPLIRLSAQYLKMDYVALRGVGSRVVGDGWCVQIVDERGSEPIAWAVLRFDEFAPVQQVVERLTNESH